ncbi:hypothetical protein BDZ45DRAFT_808766 [Acephala macrosclerotiorum]|nr:hypothetical protein BDZ45DRAFT_808766 [Acephala macrosclerotiorum]
MRPERWRRRRRRRRTETETETETEHCSSSEAFSGAMKMVLDGPECMADFGRVVRQAFVLVCSAPLSSRYSSRMRSGEDHLQRIESAFFRRTSTPPVMVMVKVMVMVMVVVMVIKVFVLVRFVWSSTSTPRNCWVRWVTIPLWSAAWCRAMNAYVAHPLPSHLPSFVVVAVIGSSSQLLLLVDRACPSPVHPVVVASSNSIA